MRVIRYRKSFIFMPRWSAWIVREWPNGKAVLKGERSWRNARGLGINYAGRSIWLVLSPRKVSAGGVSIHRFADQCPKCKAVTFGYIKCPRCSIPVEPLPEDPTERDAVIAASLAMSKPREQE